MNILQHLPLQTRYRTKFKQQISSHRSHTSIQSYSSNKDQSLQQISQRTIQKYQNKVTHNLTKQTFITRKKEFLLSRKLFYSGKSHNKKQIQLRSVDKYRNKNNRHQLFQQLIPLKRLETTPVFTIENAVMKTPFSFHRKMIINIKDDKGVKSILNKWYENNVEEKLEQLHQEQAYNRQKSLRHTRARSYVEKSEKFINNSRRKVLMSECKNYKSESIRINQDNLRKCSTSNRKCSTKDNDSDRLAKIMVRVQPFWYKVRIKI